VGRDSVEGMTELGFDHVETIPVVDGDFRDAVPEPLEREDEDDVERNTPPAESERAP